MHLSFINSTTSEKFFYLIFIALSVSTYLHFLHLDMQLIKVVSASQINSIIKNKIKKIIPEALETLSPTSSSLPTTYPLEFSYSVGKILLQPYKYNEKAQ